MGEATMENHRLGGAWTRFVVRTLALGVGIGIGGSLVLVGAWFYAHKPNGWNTSALRVKHSKAESLTRLGDDFSEKSTGTMFTLDLENTTRTDIRLPQAVTVMQTNRQTGALHGSVLKLDREYFIPAGHVVSVVLDNDDLCGPKEEPQSCFDAYFKDQGEIVIFDDARKYEIRITIPPLTLPKS